MPVTVLVGCQWGDEGKGKVADFLARRMDWVARYNGGHDSGHTVYLGREKFVLHLVPCGILQDRPRCIIGHGTIVDPVLLVQEMDGLTRRGVRLDERLYLSAGAHVVMPWHRWAEPSGGHDSRAGITLTGIGPACDDKVRCNGIRVQELLNSSIMRQKMDEQAGRLDSRYRATGETPPRPVGESAREWIHAYATAAERLRPFVADTTAMMLTALENDERILCEGSQGTFLDLDLGTYPFVTSFTTVSAGAATGLGLPPAALRKVVGICPAYSTRSGEGPFPAELQGEEANTLRRQIADHGGAASAGPLRVGWLDLAQLRHAVRINGVTGLYLTKLDLLAGLPAIKLCIAYEGPAGHIYQAPTGGHDPAAGQPVWEECEGWRESLRSMRHWRDLPAAVRRLVARIEQIAGCPIQGLSVGAPRTALVPVPPLSRRG
jgi:adenylosuccinate synthase